MKKLKKLVTLLLIINILVTTSIGFDVYAQDPTAKEGAENTEEQIEGTQENIENEETINGEEIIDSEEGGNEKQAEYDTSIRNADDAINSNEDNGFVSNASCLINYLCVGETYLQSPQEQYILVSLGEGSENVSDLKLSLIKDDGNEIELSMESKEDNIFRFSKTFTDAESGVYTPELLTFLQDGEMISVDLESIGIVARFGVDVEIPQTVDDGNLNQNSIEISVASIDTDDEEKVSEEVETTLKETGDSNVKSRMRTAKSGNTVVVLDPGHGGSESGAVANGLVEKELNLKIAQYCKNELEEYRGVTVYMTRYNDTYVGLEERVAIANSYGADFFVSITNNYTTSASPNGAEVWYPNSSYNASVYNEGKALAEEIQSQLVALGLGDRGVHYRNSESNTRYQDGSIADYYSVIKNSKLNGFPGIIVEHAFITNATDAAKLKSESFLQTLGKADATGIANYLKISKVDYSPVFDFEYYINRYADVKAAYSNDEEGALAHFINFGMKEKRQGNAEFNVVSYKNRYQDLRKMYEDDYRQYYFHYIYFGKNEGRKATGDIKQTPVTVYEGRDYSDVYNYDFYMNRQADLRDTYSDNDVGALRHFVNFGMAEGRQASEEFNVFSYKNRYPDIRKAYGNDLKTYYIHYITMGKKEGRIATGNTDVVVDKTTVYNGVDYSDIYDPDYYLDKNPDLKKIYGTDYDALIAHFVNCGIIEGRASISTFDVKSYRNKYQDLRISFGKNWSLYYTHYMNFGKKEGRKATGVSKITNPVTEYNGVDYSAVYDFEYYAEKYSDIKKAYSDDDVGAIAHFVYFGMAEKRTGNKEFDVISYWNRYPDLRKSFGNNWTSYYIHYMNFGKDEGRSAIGTTEIIGAITQYEGVDYSSVYNFKYYINKYPDIKKLYQNDDLGAIWHFVNFGISEGRQGCEDFCVNIYKNNYADLRNLYGENNSLYVWHYMNFGLNEGRNGKTAFYHMIMGETETTVQQMVKYYNSNAQYPAFYANTDAPNITRFCELYDLECKREGIKTEVAFSQAMKETNFLRYTGDVKIGQFNFAGLGATGNGVPGNSFKNVQIGIRAHVQHLKAYASSAGLNSECVDPRYQYVKKGSAPYIEWLGIQENPNPNCGWAMAKGYGYSIINGYMAKLLSY